MVFGVLGTSTLNAIPSVEINSESSRSQSDIIYRLTGVVVHTRISMNCGHYKAFICSSENNTQWFSVDDLKVHIEDIYLYAHPS